MTSMETKSRQGEKTETRRIHIDRCKNSNLDYRKLMDRTNTPHMARTVKMLTPLCTLRDRHYILLFHRKYRNW
jgi:hypothetical protein